MMIIKEWEKDSESLLKSRRRRHQQLRGTLKRGAGGGRGGRISKLHQRNVGWWGGCCVEGAKRLKWTRPRLAVPMAARTPPQMVSVSRQIIALL